MAKPSPLSSAVSQPTPPGHPTARWPRKVYAGVLLATPIVLFTFAQSASRAEQYPALGVVGQVVIISWLIAMIVAPVLGVLDAVRKLASGDADGLRVSAVLVKLAAIAFFVPNFVLVAAFALLVQLLASMFAAGAVLALFNLAGVGIIIAITYLLMLPTSAYGWAALIWLRRRRAISNQFFVGHAILHAIFVTDIISSLIVASKVRDVRYPNRLR